MLERRHLRFIFRNTYWDGLTEPYIQVPVGLYHNFASSNCTVARHWLENSTTVYAHFTQQQKSLCSLHGLRP